MKEGLSALSVRAPWELAGMPHETPVLLALSGGADSSALLHLLSERARTDGFPITVAHVDHRIRGSEAERDAEFCRSLAGRYGWDFELLCEDIPALAKERGTGLEETARDVRYAFFERLMRERKIPLLAVAHHADDNMETVLFHLCRGTGLQGLCGIAPVRSFAGGFLTRPLLPFTRREIEAYCGEQGLDHVRDSTNSDVTYSRNRIRLQAIPALEQVAKDPQKRVYAATRALAQDLDYLGQAAKTFLAEHLQAGALPVEALRQVHPAVRRHVILSMAPAPLETVHVEMTERLIARGISGSSCSLPGGVRACIQQGRFTVLPELRGEALSEPMPFGEGSFSVCDGRLTVCVTKIENSCDVTKVHNLSTPLYLIPAGLSDIMLQQMFWRTRREGDVLLLRGMHRKLRRLYREAGVPPPLRDALPLLCDAEGIVWAPLIGARDGFPPAEAAGSRFAYRVELTVSGWETDKKNC